MSERAESPFPTGALVTLVILRPTGPDVVIGTLNALRYQTRADFEVVVVGATEVLEDAALQAWAPYLKQCSLDGSGTAKALNAALKLSAGELVLFLDGDITPEPEWIERATQAFEDAAVGAVGLPSGAESGHGCALVDRVYSLRSGVRPPPTAFRFKDADLIAVADGGLVAFRRLQLAAIDGFDENIEGPLGFAEACRRLAERGLYAVAGNEDSEARSGGALRPRRIQPASTDDVRDRCYLALAEWRRSGRGLQAAVAACDAVLLEALADLQLHLRPGGAAQNDSERRESALRAAAEEGRRLGLSAPRGSVDFSAPAPGFRPFPVHRPPGGRLRLCFLARQVPGEDSQSDRVSRTLAGSFAARGHLVTVVGGGVGRSTGAYQDGLWIYSVANEVVEQQAATSRWSALFESRGARAAFALSQQLHAAVLELSKLKRFDLVVFELDGGVGLHCVRDKALRSVLVVSRPPAHLLNQASTNTGGNEDEALILEEIIWREARRLHIASETARRTISGIASPANGCVTVFCPVEPPGGQGGAKNPALHTGVFWSALQHTAQVGNDHEAAIDRALQFYRDDFSRD